MVSEISESVDKKGMVEIDMLIYLLIAVGVVVIVFVLYGIITGNLGSVIESVKNIFRFGR